MEIISERAMEISIYTDLQFNKINSGVNSIESLSELARKNSVVSSDVSAAIEELSATSEQTAGIAERLTSIGEGLRRAIERFRV